MAAPSTAPRCRSSRRRCFRTTASSCDPDGGGPVKGVIRPEKRILPDAAAVPAKNQAPVPRRFTHELAAEQPFFYSLRDTEPAAPCPPAAASVSPPRVGHGAASSTRGARGLHGLRWLDASALHALTANPALYGRGTFRVPRSSRHARRRARPRSGERSWLTRDQHPSRDQGDQRRRGSDRWTPDCGEPAGALRAVSAHDPTRRTPAMEGRQQQGTEAAAQPAGQHPEGTRPRSQLERVLHVRRQHARLAPSAAAARQRFRHRRLQAAAATRPSRRMARTAAPSVQSSSAQRDTRHWAWPSRRRPRTRRSTPA